MRILELFSGYGTASFALRRLGIIYEIIGYSDIDKYANQCFKQNHYTSEYEMVEQGSYPGMEIKIYPKELGNVRDINPNELPDFDLLTGGFPCQSFSVAGKGLGELDTRGTLFYEIIRIAEIKKPRYMLLENVKGLTTKPHKDTYLKILSELDRLGYIVFSKVLNSKDYGIPQNRERVWFVCFRDSQDADAFQWPEKEELKLTIKDILEPKVDPKYYLNEVQTKKLVDALNKKLTSKQKGEIDKVNLSGHQSGEVHNVDGIMSTLYATQYKEPPKIYSVEWDLNKEGLSSQQNRAYEVNGIAPCLQTGTKPNIFQIDRGTLRRGEWGTGIHEEVSGTLNSSSGSDFVVGDPKFIDTYNKSVKDISPTLTDPCHNSLRLFEGGMFRRLTPKECFRLMGFLNDEINLEGLSDTQCYKLAGNGQDVNVVSKIFEKMFRREEVNVQINKTMVEISNKIAKDVDERIYNELINTKV